MHSAYYFYYRMAQRKSWSKQEDRLLVMLREERSLKKWCEIAEIMRIEFGIQGRNGKQCRERFHNHLDARITKAEWNAEEDLQLVWLHNGMGNKWAQIARQIKGRTDNCVKNRFYTKFRRSIRLLNECIKKFWRKQFKTLKQAIITKIIEFSEEKSSSLHSSHETMPYAPEDLKSRLLNLSEITVDEIEENQKKTEIYELIKEIAQFNRVNRRRGKKKRQPIQPFNQQIQEEILEVKAERFDDDSDSEQDNSFSCQIGGRRESRHEKRGDLAEAGTKVQVKSENEKKQNPSLVSSLACQHSPNQPISDLSQYDSLPRPNYRLIEMKEPEDDLQMEGNLWDVENEFKFDLY